jgi:hypothetical protein
LNLTLTYLDAKTQAELQTLAVSRPYVVVVDYYGNSFLCGLENGMEVTGGTVVTGAAAGDLSGFTLTFEGMEETAPYFLASPVTGDAAHSTIVKHYIFDEDDPRRYYVYPGASSTSTFIEIVYSDAPSDLANTSATLDVDDIYANAVVDYALYRAFMKDAENAGNQQRAQAHFALFNTSIGNGAQISNSSSPNLDPIRNAPPPVGVQVG